MRDLEELKRLIEEERMKLDREAAEGDMKARYRISLVLDGLLEEYLDVKEGVVPSAE